MEEETVQMPVLNNHVVALCARESLETFLLSLLAFKCTIIVLVTCCILYMKGLDAAGTMPQRWPVQVMWKTSYMSTEPEPVATFYVRLCWTMRGTRMRTTLLG